MKKDIFSTWVREFCSLVFIQTIQAFIFAIVMTLIISVMTPDNVTGVERADIVSATGFIAVIALASISKIEDLVKKIFGVQSNITDPSMRGGMKSLASTMIAAKLAKGVLDNGKKAAGGLGGVYSANKQMRIAKSRYARDMSRKLGEPASNKNTGGTATSAPPTSSAASTSQAPATVNDYYQKAKEAKKNGDMPGYYKNIGIAAGMQKNMNATNAPAVGAGGTGGNIASVAAAGEAKAARFSNKNMADIDKMRDAYEDKMSELKAKRAESVIKGLSGLVETGGALVGGTAGAIAGASLGDVGDTLKYGLAGVGIGDAVGSVPGKVALGTKNIAQAVAADNRSKKEFADAMANLSSDAKKYINTKRTNTARYERAKDEFAKFQKQVMDAGNLE